MWMHFIEPAESIHIHWTLEGFDRPEELRQLHNGIGSQVVHPKTKPSQNLRKRGIQRKTQSSNKEIPKHHALSIARVRSNFILRRTTNSRAKISLLLITLNQLLSRPRLTKNKSRRRLFTGTHQLRRISLHVGQILLPLGQLPPLLHRRFHVLGSDGSCSILQPGHP